MAPAPDGQRPVRGRHDDAAFGKVAREEAAEHGLGGSVEGARRLVEKPDAARCDEQARERGAPLLAGGKRRGGKVGKPADPDRLERFLDAAAAGEHAAPEAEVGGDRQ